MLTKESIIFAPLEGFTDPIYRDAVRDTCPHWHFQFTDFLRFPTVGILNSKRVKEFLGETYLSNKYPFQILTNLAAATRENFRALSSSNILWLDLNFGCPSKKVCSHGGGASLLDRPDEIKKIIKRARSEFGGFLTAKIRMGFSNDNNFLELLDILEGEGVDAITIHARTRAQMYKGPVSLKHIALAVKRLKIPIIGNGDIATVSDIKRMFEETGCHSVMIGRGALSNPWIPMLIDLSDEEIFVYRLNSVEGFIKRVGDSYSVRSSNFALIKLKQLTSYLFKEFSNEREIVSKLLRSKTLQSYMVAVQDYIKKESS
jgi:tRNA-dihydrouridine synthase